GRRDHALLLLAYQTGLRVSELTALTRGDIHLGTGAHVRCRGKGRKDRATPLTSQTVEVLRIWLAELGGQSNDPVFPTRAGRPPMPLTLVSGGLMSQNLMVVRGGRGVL